MRLFDFWATLKPDVSYKFFYLCDRPFISSEFSFNDTQSMIFDPLEFEIPSDLKNYDVLWIDLLDDTILVFCRFANFVPSFNLDGEGS